MSAAASAIAGRAPGISGREDHPVVLGLDPRPSPPGDRPVEPGDDGRIRTAPGPAGRRTAEHGAEATP